MATAYTVMNVKGSTQMAKQTAYMTLVYHNLIYLIMSKVVITEDSMITKEFAVKLAKAKTPEALDRLVEELVEKHFPTPIQSGWNIPKLQDMEPELIHLTTYWLDRKVSFYKIV